MTTISERFKIIREHNEMTQEELAKALRLSRDQISLIETEKRPPKKDTIDLICYKFNINYNWITNGKGNMFIDPFGYSDNCDKIERIFSKVSKLPVKEQDRILRMIDAFLEE